MDSQDEPTVVCSNCEKSIPESKSFLHEAYCFRHIIRCPKCNEPIHKEEVDEHHKQAHSLVSCKYCKKDFESKALASHEEKCTQKPKLCQFCKCEISSEEYNDHIYQCGSRTRKCAFCNQNILVRDLESHEVACEVEQFSRDSNIPFRSEERKNDKFEELLSMQKKRGVLGESRQNFKKQFEPPRKAVETKKRLTKLSEKQDTYDSKTQEEIDEEMARELNEEFYEGRRRNPERNQRKYERQKTQEEIDEELAQKMNKEYFEGRRGKDKEKGNPRKQKKKYYGEDSEDEEEKAKKVDEEFFGLRKKGKGKMEVEDDDEEYARKLQEEFDKGSKPQQNANKTNNNIDDEYQYEEENYYDDEDIEEISESTYLDKTTQKSKTKPKTKNVQPVYEPEDYNLEHDDPELQRAIQASLEGWH